MKTPLRFLTTLVAASLTVGSVSVAHAALLTYEGFTGYPTTPPNDIVTQNGGTGWGTAWFSDSSDGFLHGVRTPTTIAYPGYDGSSTPAASGGNYLNLAAAFGGSNPTPVFRQLDASVSGVYDTNGYLLSPGVIGADGTTLWGSFLYSNDGLGFGISTKTLQFEGGGTFATILDQTVVSNLIVFRFDFGVGATDTVTLFSNPNLATFDGTTGGVTSAAGDYSFNTIRLIEDYSFGPGDKGSEGQYDDIRFGTTLADVAPVAVPEPASALLLGFGVAALFMVRRRTGRESA